MFHLNNITSQKKTAVGLVLYGKRSHDWLHVSHDCDCETREDRALSDMSRFIDYYGSSLVITVVMINLKTWTPCPQ